MYLLKMAWRNIFRNKRRTILNIIAIAVNIAIIIFVVAYMRYIIEDRYSKVPKYLTGHIQIHNSEYESDKGDEFPLKYTIDKYQSICNITSKIDGVIFAGNRIEFSGIAGNGKDLLPIQGIAFEPEKESKFGIIDDKIKEGNYLEPKDSSILIGDKMAELMNLKVGDSLKLYIRTKDNSKNIADLKISGIFKTSFAMIDKSYIYMTIPTAKSILKTGSEPTEIIIGLEDRNDVEPVIKELNSKLTGNLKKGINIDSWVKYSRGSVDDLKNTQTFMLIFVLILLLIAVFGMITTMYMNVFERKNEIGTIRSIGMDSSQVKNLFLLEGMVTSLLGVVAGCIIGGLISYIVSKVGIPVPSAESRTVPTPERLYTDSRYIEFVGAIIIGIMTGAIGSILPAIRISKLKVVDALKND